MIRQNLPKMIEEKRVNFIITSINTDTDIGLRIKESYKTLFNKKIQCVLDSGGTRKDHYDFTLIHSDATIVKCEEKGTEIYIPNIDGSIIPWKYSVQRFNCPGNKISIGKDYARLWYDNIVTDDEINTTFGIQKEIIPTFEKWCSDDAFQSGDPKTHYGRTLKKNFREKYGNTSMNGKKGSPFDYREKVNPLFISHFNLDQNNKRELIEETQTMLDSIMDEKDCWFQTSGMIENLDKFNFKWHKKIEAPKIIDVVPRWKKGSDIYFDFETVNIEDKFSCILRFGKGTGFSNIRYDIR